MAEFMWAGKPIVATKVDAIPNLISDGVNGLLVEKDDVDAVVEASIRIYEDEELAEQLCEQGRKIVSERFSIKRVVAEHEKMFKKMGIKTSPV